MPNRQFIIPVESSSGSGGGGGAPSGPAGGALSGSYPNPTLAVLNSAGGVGGFYSDGRLSLPAAFPTDSVATSNLANGSANAVWGIQFVLPCAISVNQITIRSNAAGSDDVGVGIYTSTGSAIIRAAFVNIGATTTSTASVVQQTIGPGTYYLAWSESSTSAGITYWTTQATGNLSNQVSSSNNIFVQAANGSSSGVMPATLGTLTGVSIAAMPYAQFNLA